MGLDTLLRSWDGFRCCITHPKPTPIASLILRDIDEWNDDELKEECLVEVHEIKIRQYEELFTSETNPIPSMTKPLCLNLNVYLVI